MPIKTAEFVPPTVEEQREAGSQKTGFTALVTDKRMVHNAGGRTAVVGEMDPGKAPGRMQDKRFAQAEEAMRNRHRDTNIRPVTLINLLPIPLVVNSPMPSIKNVRVPACMNGDGFTSYTWEKPAVEVMYVGEGVNMPYDFMPRSLANSFTKEYAEFGGVFILEGYAPESEAKASPEVQEQFKAARARMQAWKMKEVEKGNGMWNTLNHSGQNGIGDIQRECAQSLYEEGILPNLPPWITIVRTTGQVAKTCSQCGTIPNIGAAKCLACQHIIDPAAAFAAGLIEEDDASLERLTRAEVIELGISAYVAETVDEKADRRAAGLPKPKSISQRNAEKAQAREAEKAAEKAAGTPAKAGKGVAAAAAESAHTDTTNM
jgi:hypothetical protein